MPKHQTLKAFLLLSCALAYGTGSASQETGAGMLEEAWPFDGSNAGMTAVPNLSGYYALADPATLVVEIRDIRQELLARISRQSIEQLGLTPGHSQLCGITFTPSGRLLFLGLRMGGQDIVLRYNQNTRELGEFARVRGHEANTRCPMSYFEGVLYVAAHDGLAAFQAGRNQFESVKPETWPTPDKQHVTGLALDTLGKTLFVSTPAQVYRARLENGTLGTGDPLVSLTGIEGITWSRSFRPGGGHLFILQKQGTESRILEAVPTADGVSVRPVFTSGKDMAEIAATPEGRLLIASGQASTLTSQDDPHLGFDEWLVDELRQYVKAIKMLTGPASGIPEGFLARKLVDEGERFNQDPIADNVGWALYVLMAADLADPDPEIEHVIESLVRRHAGQHPDGKGGKRTIDGNFFRTYDSKGELTRKSVAQVYTTMKFLPAVFKAADLYPDNENLANFKEILRQEMKRSGDTIRANQRITWEMDDYGPVHKSNRMTNETWLFGDLAAAQDPLAEQDYRIYVRDRTSMDYDDWLEGEPVIRASHSAFIVFGGSQILRHHAESEDWQEQNRNYYAASMAAGDDMGAPYSVAFSAGNNRYLEKRSYYNDGPSDHPGDYIHFPALLGFGQLGISAPVVGAYMAYRDGLRQQMQGVGGAEGPLMLTRKSILDLGQTVSAIGIADFWFGATGLAEIIKPGTADRLRGEFYRPDLQVSHSGTGQTVLNYSRITPRLVRASVDGVQWDELGFQLSPFTLETETDYRHFAVEAPGGTFIEIPNRQFEQGLKHWREFGDFDKQVKDERVHISSQTERMSATGGVLRTLDLSSDLEGTDYVVRVTGSGDSGGYLLLQWDEDELIANGVLETSTAKPAPGTGSRVSYRLDARKPATANFAHVILLAENTNATGFAMSFDELSLVRIGKPLEIANGGFETGGLKNWWKSSDAITITRDKDDVLEGRYSARFSPDAGQTSWQSLVTNVSVREDKPGTRYIFKFDARTSQFDDSDFEVLVETLDKQGKRLFSWNDAGDVVATTDGEVAFSVRKRPGTDSFKLVFRMRRLGNKIGGDDQVIIDNLRMLKENLL